MKGLKSTIVLLLILVALVGYIYYADRDGGSESDLERAFALLEAGDIVEVQIRSASGETSRVEKSGETWRLVEPVQAEADSAEISSITSSLATLDIQRVVDENASDLGQYGLEPARIEVGFRTTDDQEPRRLLLGEKTPTGGDLYARFPDQTRVFLVSSFVDATFNKDTFALRDKSIIDIERDAVERLEIDAGDRDITLAKAGNEWRIAAPISARADFAAVEGSLERLASGRMEGIAAPEAGTGELKKYGLDPAVATVTAVSGSSRATLLFGETENALLYAKDASRPIVFTVAPTLYTDVIRDLAEYRRKDLFDSRSFTTTRIELRRGSETVVLEKTTADGKDTWRNASGATVETARVEDLLGKISNLRALSFATAAAPALKSPELTVIVRFDESKNEQVAFARAGADVVAARSDEPGTATVDTAAYEDAVKALDAL
jgi:hypothetical protein